jgi:hypothetical protein
LQVNDPHRDVGAATFTTRYCRLEANRWNLVAEGVRDLAAATPAAAKPARPRHTGPRVLAGPGRRARLMAAAAAALVLLGGAGYGAAALSGHALGTAGTGTQTTLTVVTGCARLEQAVGTLEQVNGTSVVIKTASGRPVTVTTTATTRVNASGPLLSDITDGALVTVVGPSSGGTIAADLVAVGGRASLAALPGLVMVQGTVSDASSAGFTVVTSAGTRVPVTTSGGTAVTIFPASLGQLQAGASTIAVSYAGPDGTLSALAVLQPPSWPPGAHTTVTVRDCSPASIEHVIMALASGG